MPGNDCWAFLFVINYKKITALLSRYLLGGVYGTKWKSGLLRLAQIPFTLDKSTKMCYTIQLFSKNIVGYINDPRSKSVIVDKEKVNAIRAAFKLYAKGRSRLEDMVNFFAQHGITTRNGQRVHRDRVAFILSNPFYYGHFKYGQEIYEGKHKPIISKKLFDDVQAVLTGRSRPRHNHRNNPKAFCGLLRCGECHMMITAETQKGHTYYRCNKKSKGQKCTQPYVREEEIDQQLSEMIQKVSLPEAWAGEMLKMWEQDKKDAAQSSVAFVRKCKEKLQAISSRLNKLLSGYLDQDIEQEVYRSEKAKLMSEKKTLEEEIIKIGQKQYDRLEPLKEWIILAKDAAKIATSPDRNAKKALVQKIFGSNLFLQTKKAHGIAKKPWTFLAENGACWNFVPLWGFEPQFSP